MARPLRYTLLAVAVCVAAAGCAAPAAPAERDIPSFPLEVTCDLSALPAATDGPGELVYYDPDKAYPGFTLFEWREDLSATFLNMEGQAQFQVYSPNDKYTAPNVPKPLPDFGVYFQPYKEFSRPFIGEFMALDGDGNVTFEWEPPKEWERIHHDNIILPNGNLLTLIFLPGDTNPNIPMPFTNDLIVEVTPEGEVVWQWNTADHWDQLQLPDEFVNSVMNWDNPDTEFRFHTNSLQILPPNQWEAEHPEFSAGNIMISQRRTNRVLIIDPDSGDVVWVSPVETNGQHMPRLIPEGLPGAGNIMVFDNGVGGQKEAGPTRDYSRVLEFNPVTGEIVWQYDASMSGEDRTTFFSDSRGSEQRLPNGNTLIADSPNGRIFEVTVDGEVVWDYRYETEIGLYRALRVEEAWGCGGSPGFENPWPW